MYCFVVICILVTKTSYDRYLLAEWIHRVGENTSDIRVGTLRTVTACYRLVAFRILPRLAGSPALQSGRPGCPGRRLSKPCAYHKKVKTDRLLTE